MQLVRCPRYPVCSMQSLIGTEAFEYVLSQKLHFEVHNRLLPSSAWLSALSRRTCDVLQCFPRASQGLAVAGLQDLDLSHSITTSQALLDQVAGLNNLTCLWMGESKLSFQ